MLLYGDEVVPGSFLRPETNRKFMGYYISFAEFGAAMLCQDEAWFPFAVLMTDKIENVACGASGVLASILQNLLLGAQRIQNGIVLNLPGNAPVLITLEFGNLIGDEDFLAMSMNTKSSSGLLC
jgi:hypothetical protein